MYFAPARSSKIGGCKVGRSWLRKQAWQSGAAKLEVAKLEAIKTVVAKSECKDLGTLTLTSFAQHVTFGACQMPQNLRTQSWTVLTQEASQTVGSHKVGSCKDGSRKVRMSRLKTLNITSFAQYVAFFACQKPQNLRTRSWKVLDKVASQTVGSSKVGSRKDSRR